MPSELAPIDIDLHEAMHSVQVRVQLRRVWRVRLGLWVLKLGCWLTGAQYVEEFPMSLIQPGGDHGS